MQFRKVENYELTDERKERIDAINGKKRDIFGKLVKIQTDMRLAGSCVNELTTIDNRLNGFLNVRSLGDWDVKEYFTQSRDYTSLKFRIDSGVTKYDEKGMGHSGTPTGFLAKATNNTLMHFSWVPPYPIPSGSTDFFWEVVWRQSGEKGEPVVNFKVPNEDLWLSASSASSTTLVPWPSGTLWIENPALMFQLFGTLQNCKIGSVQVNFKVNDGAYLRAIAPLKASGLSRGLEPEKGVPVSASGADGIPNITWTLTYISGGTFTASGEHARV